MGYGDWVKLKIVNNSKTKSIQIKNATLSYGKFYTENDQDNNLSPEQIDGIVIAPESSAKICASGRDYSLAGTEGSIDLYDGNIKIITVDWNCPHNDPGNSLKGRDYNGSYDVVFGPWNNDFGPLGEVEIGVIEIEFAAKNFMDV